MECVIQVCAGEGKSAHPSSPPCTSREEASAPLAGAFVQQLGGAYSSSQLAVRMLYPNKKIRAKVWVGQGGGVTHTRRALVFL